MDTSSSHSIDAFIDALWLEEGLSKNTLSAYRRDLSLFTRWTNTAGSTLDATQEHQLLAYFAQRHAQTRATSANRRLTVFKRYFRWALRERRINADPTLKLLAFENGGSQRMRRAAVSAAIIVPLDRKSVV